MSLSLCAPTPQCTLCCRTISACSQIIAHCLQETAEEGACQTVHVLVATYTEPADLVKECVLRLLVAPEPLYMRKVIYVCDDGWAGEEGALKRKMVAHLNMLGALVLAFAFEQPPLCAWVTELLVHSCVVVVIVWPPACSWLCLFGNLHMLSACFC